MSVTKCIGDQKQGMKSISYRCKVCWLLPPSEIPGCLRGPKCARCCFCLSEALGPSDFREQISLAFSYLELEQRDCPIPQWGEWRAHFWWGGHHPFSSPHSLASVQLLLIYTPDYHSRLQPSVPYNHFRVGHPYNSSSWPDTVAGLLTSQEGFFIEHHLNQFYLFLTTCFNLPPPSLHCLTKAKCQA